MLLSIAADALSPGLKELLKTEQIGYYDRGDGYGSEGSQARAHGAAL